MIRTMLKQVRYLLLTTYNLLLITGLLAQQTEKVYLSGTGSYDTKQWDFFCTSGSNANKWTTIAVPSCWELQGFGKYDYGYAKDSVRGKEKGIYKHTFNVPAAWKGKVINIVFEGVMTDAAVKVNGKSAGEMHQGAFYAFKYDITKLLKYGKENVLEVTVAKHSANASVNEAERKGDYWIFGGIFRPVWLEVLPVNYMESFAINATAEGEFHAYFMAGDMFADVKTDLYSMEGKLLASSRGAEQENVYRHVAIYKNQFFASHKLWTPESPNLYKAVFTLYKNNKIQHTITEKFGFRTVELKQRDGIYVNGVKMKFKGVNRHSFRPETGRTTSKQISIEDVLLMKDMNMNAVRMSHYPPR